MQREGNKGPSNSTTAELATFEFHFLCAYFFLRVLSLACYLKATVCVIKMLLFSQLYFNQGEEYRMFHRCIFAGETTDM